MATPTYITGFEHGLTPPSGVGGLVSLIQNAVIDSTEKNTGSYSLKAIPNVAPAFMRVVAPSTPGELCGRFYFKIETEPADNSIIFDLVLSVGAVGIYPRIYVDVAENTVSIRSGATVVATSSNTYTVGSWHYIDWYCDLNQNPWTLKASLDGGTEFSGTIANAADSVTYYRIGQTTGTSTMIVYYDDLIISHTLSDYPFGPGGTELLVPAGSSTSNPGTNVLEEADGTDVNSSSYLAIASIPMGETTNYIKQVAAGTGNYMGAAFANLSHSHSSVLGALAIMAYTSSATQPNRGACIISKDGFSTFTEVWGNPTTRLDYSDGSLSSLGWKSVIVSGVVDDTTANALEVRLGYSEDASPNPYWVDIAIEVAYTSSSNDISLALVSYTSSVPALVVLENEVTGLDLVTYSSSFFSVGFTENIPVSLDLINQIGSFNDVVILSNELVALDLIGYIGGFNDITVLENTIISLDLVGYSTSMFSITTTENALANLDLVLYSVSIQDVELLEEGSISLDRVLYSISFPNLMVLESSEILLEGVQYSNIVLDGMILEDELIGLAVVTYIYSVTNLFILEDSTEILELVSYSFMINDVEFEIQIPIASPVPAIRTYSIREEKLVFPVQKELRIYSVEKENRSHSNI